MTDPVRKGLLITFEGGEGAGKSTQVRRLVERLNAAGHPALATREPGGTPKAEAIRTLLLSGAAARLGAGAEAILFSAARIDHVDRLIRPTLDAGLCVVSDRYIDSTQAYQGVLGHVGAPLIAALEHASVGATRPDLTVILDLPSALGLARAAARRGAEAAPDRFEQEGDAFHGKLRAAFQAIAALEPARCHVIDATPAADVVAEAVWALVSGRFRLERARTAVSA